VIGDTAADAAVTARLLLATGVRSTRVLSVPATGGSQAVVLGSYGTSGTSAEFYNSQIRLGRPVTFMAPASGTTVFSTTLRDFSGAAAPTVDVSFGTADGTGTVQVTGLLATGGMMNVRHGTLNVDGFGTLSASGVGIDSGATLAGIGLVTATLSGAGLVAPGNSPGILTAQAVDPTGGLDWAFEFSGTAAPDYGNAENSLNDILRLTGATPLTAGLNATNVVSLYLPANAAAGAVYPGGFFIDSGASFANFQSLVSSGAIVAYYQSGSGAFSYNGQQYALLSDKGFQVDWGVTTVPSAGFDGGSTVVTNGQMTTFSVVVPEPGTLALAALGLGLAGYAFRRRRAA
jgi:hypothetical protein